MTDHRETNGQQHSLAEYLKGALASHHIVNTGKRIDCKKCQQASNSSDILILFAPKVAIVGALCQLRLRVNNLNDAPSSGTIHLSGTGNIRRRAYEFTAPFQLEKDEKALCMAFQWQAPDFPTHIEWAVTLQGEGKMGMSVSKVSETSVVKELRSAVE